MANLATLAPPFDSETAKINQKKSAEARRLRKEAAFLAQSPELPIIRAKKQINRVLYWMERTNDKDEYVKLAGVLDRLWNKAFPTQAAVKPNRGRERSQVAEPLVETPQEPSAGA